MEKREIQDYDEVELQITKRMRDQGHPIRVCQGGTNYTDMEQAAVQASKQSTLTWMFMQNLPVPYFPDVHKNHQ